jgi:hypothetical protein
LEEGRTNAQGTEEETSTWFHWQGKCGKVDKSRWPLHEGCPQASHAKGDIEEGEEGERTWRDFFLTRRGLFTAYGMLLSLTLLFLIIYALVTGV